MSARACSRHIQLHSYILSSVSMILSGLEEEPQIVRRAVQTIGRVGATTDLISQHIEQADGQQAKRDLLMSLVSKIPVRACTHALRFN